jgi:hypothetical protein
MKDEIFLHIIYCYTHFIIITDNNYYNMGWVMAAAVTAAIVLTDIMAMIKSFLGIACYGIGCCWKLLGIVVRK